MAIYPRKIQFDILKCSFYASTVSFYVSASGPCVCDVRVLSHNILDYVFSCILNLFPSICIRFAFGFFFYLKQKYNYN